MKEVKANIYYKDEPVLLDRVFQGIQEKLADKLPWLDYVFGRAYRLTEYRTDGTRFFYPAAYVGDGEYLSLLPNDNLGNFSWFDLYDPQEVTYIKPYLPQLEFSGALVLWFNLTRISDDATMIYTEEVKQQVLELLTSPNILGSIGQLTPRNIYERFENIYKGYSIENIYGSGSYSNLQDIDKQYFLYPYAGMRIEFTLITRELCKKY